MLRNGLEPWHVLVTVAVLVLLFGSKKLPEMARGLGKSMRILKSETAAMREEEVPSGGSGSGSGSGSGTGSGTGVSSASAAGGPAESARRS
ncbi:Sec-independent protein translocase subunit TatA [Kitasatospora sp. NPDC058444]|uniref:Sec-independent protein translocase subunit TatA n=1 Tax=Kitasatospora sp. NPDC058444 TaxID=3346504 RepID=UPI00366921F0